MSNTFDSIDQIKRANEGIGHSWFDPTTTQYHGTAIETGIIGGRYFVESGHRIAGDSASGRVFRAVAADPSGAVSYLKGGDTFDTLGEAQAYIEGVIG